MSEPEEIFCICVREHEDHIREAILTECVKCGTRVWVSITNCDKKTICMACITTIEEAEFYVTPETLAEAIREKDRLIPGKPKQPGGKQDDTTNSDR